MSMNVPESSNNVPESSNNVPEMSMNVPEMSMNVPEMSMNVPEMSMNVPEMSMNVPESSMNVFDSFMKVLRPEKLRNGHEMFKNVQERPTVRYVGRPETFILYKIDCPKRLQNQVHVHASKTKE
jgi:hypothetical protein